jgi:hypothetical protein
MYFHSGQVDISGFLNFPEFKCHNKTKIDHFKTGLVCHLDPCCALNLLELSDSLNNLLLI